MAKNNVKVELKKYISPEEKAKNTFIFSCVILIILMFAIFITYSFFISESGDKTVTSTTAATPNITFTSSIVSNTNGQQKDVTIKNNTGYYFSYNLHYTSSSAIYYKIPDTSHAAPSGIIAPLGSIKVRLVSANTNFFNSSDSSIGLGIDSGYQYTPLQTQKSIEFSTLNSSTSISNLSVSGQYYLSPSFRSTVTSYSLYVSNTTTSVTFNVTPSSSGKLVPSSFSSLVVGDNNKTMNLYAQDGTLIKTYTIKIVRAHSQGGLIRRFLIIDTGNSGKIISEYKNENGIPFGKITMTGDNDTSSKTILHWEYLDDEWYCPTLDDCKYRVQGGFNSGGYSSVKEMSTTFMGSFNIVPPTTTTPYGQYQITYKKNS